jgi:hypothetical protein
MYAGDDAIGGYHDLSSNWPARELPDGYRLNSARNTLRVLLVTLRTIVGRTHTNFRRKWKLCGGRLKWIFVVLVSRTSDWPSNWMGPRKAHLMLAYVAPLPQNRQVGKTATVHNRLKTT